MEEYSLLFAVMFLFFIPLKWLWDYEDEKKQKEIFKKSLDEYINSKQL